MEGAVERAAEANKDDHQKQTVSFATDPFHGESLSVATLQCFPVVPIAPHMKEETSLRPTVNVHERFPQHHRRATIARHIGPPTPQHHGVDHTTAATAALIDRTPVHNHSTSFPSVQVQQGN